MPLPVVRPAGPATLGVGRPTQGGHGRLLEPDRYLRPEQSDEQVAVVGIPRSGMAQKSDRCESVGLGVPCRRSTSPRAAAHNRANGLSRSSDKRLPRPIAGREQARQGGELPGCKPPCRSGRLTDRASHRFIQAVARHGAGDLQQRFDQGLGRGWSCRVPAQQFREQRRHVRDRRTQDGRAHPRVFPIASRQPGEGLARAMVVPVAHRQGDLKPDARIGVIGQS